MIVELHIVENCIASKAYINMEFVRVIRPHHNDAGIEFAELHFSDGWVCHVRETCDQIIGNNHRKAKELLEKTHA